MRKSVWLISALLGISLMLVALPALAQWGAVQSGVDALKRGKEAEKKPAPAPGAPAAAGAPATSPSGKPVSTAPATYTNKARGFSYTIPAGWSLERGDPAGNDPIFMKPGTTCGFNMTINQMVPSFPRKASVDASYKQAMEEKTIGKYLAVKRRDQGAVIGWETIETAEKGSGGFQRIQWQCYDGQNYYYNFMAHSEPKDFGANRSQLQGIIDSIRFGAKGK
ncbi:MAG: hypothetical protein FJ126_05875 [Deltaproteobacteria bacterium]|nr:hypothetical protein [Deltaproteobacteria bacterium]